METSVSNDANRKVNFENLSKEDLIKKCAQLLQIGQKAKQSKIELQEENNKLKEELNRKNAVSDPVFEEIITNLTHQKLVLTNENTDLETRCNNLVKKIEISEIELKECEEKLNICDNENTSYKRQIQRLTNENEQLITDLDALESQVIELKKVKQIQNEQEKSLNELGSKLNASLEEIQKLETENSALLNKIENLQINLGEKDKNLVIISEELTSSKSIISNYSKDIHELQGCISTTEKNNEELNDVNNKLKQKLKFYHSKIVKFAGIAKDLRQNKTEILYLFKSYIDQVTDWKEQLNSGEKNIVKYLNSVEEENKLLKQKLEHHEQSEQDLTLDTSNLDSEIKIIADRYETEKACLQKELVVCQSKFSAAKFELESILNNSLEKIEFLSLEIEELKKNNFAIEKQKLDNEIKYKEEIDDCINKLNDVESLKSALENENLKLEEKLTASKEKLEELSEEITELMQQQLIDRQKIEDYKGEQTTVNNKLEDMTIVKLEFEQNKLKLETELEELKKIFAETNEKLTLEEISTNKFLEEKQSIEKKFEFEKINLINRLEEVEEINQNLVEECEKYKSEFVKFQFLKDDKLSLEAKLVEINKTIKEQENEIQLLRKENVTTSKIKEDLIEELEKLNLERKVFKQKSDDFNSRTRAKLQEYENVVSELQNQVRSVEELEMRSTEEIKHLAEENKQLVSQNELLQEKLQKFELALQNKVDSYSQTNEVPYVAEEVEEQLSNLKRENAELLSEMNEMNQAIKERGENISKLEAHCEEVLKKLQIYETQANKNIDNLTEKEKLIEDLTNELKELKSNCNQVTNDEIAALQSEIETLKTKLNTSIDVPDNDAMSTSTISRTEDLNRLKDLEGSWEEKYGKLRNLAVKLKGKVRELTVTISQQQSENEEMQKKLSCNIKTIQNLQNQCDKLEDDLDKSKKECKQAQNQLNMAANDISRDKQLLADREETVGALRAELENAKKEKQATDTWKKQVGSKIQTLRKELEANNVLKKEFEAQIASLNNSLESKELALKNEIEKHKHTKNLLDQSNSERKKNSVLSLEMQDYERGAKESSKKLEKQQEEINKLNNQIESQKTTLNALREQNKLLEETISSSEENLNTVTSEINTYKKQIAILEDEISQKVEKIHSITQQLEISRSETEELSTELSKVIAEHQKTNNFLKSDRDKLSNENLLLQQNLRDVQNKLRLNRDELRAIQTEYDGYKVRAQSVLRQNQTRDVGVEEKLSEEVASFVAQNLALMQQLNESRTRIECLETDNNKLSVEIKDYANKVKELEEDCEEIKTHFAELSAKYEKTVSENAETLRNLKVHADTLSQCYKQQLADQESRHSREILELQSRLEKAPSPTDVSPVLITMPRGEGEGSESIESNGSASVLPVPLERLLGGDSDHENDRIKKKLQEHEAKVIHLTALLSDTEQDLVKHIQMNKLLKEEIRRQQRSEEREKHAENLEYLKNVVFKFVTLGSGDERSRLVPVLNTILKLSPDETKELNLVAKGGELNLRGWSSYLPGWSSPNKPQ